VQGTGLGLHIITKYLELMNGRIEMESELEKGSLFTIFIPQINPES
jgi:signal transduction histidine kinase